MREIKFRAWDKSFKVMCYEVQNPINVGCDSLYFHHFLQDGFELMQFTGLKDKNGKEIYEGDIIKNPEAKYLSPEEVRWSGKGSDFCGFTLHDKKYFTNHLCKTITDQSEIIGNIYENANLLNDNK